MRYSILYALALIIVLAADQRMNAQVCGTVMPSASVPNRDGDTLNKASVRSGPTTTGQDVSKLIGTIYDALGSVVVGAYITAMDSDGNVFGAITNDSGNYTLTLPVNRYKSRPGFFKEARYDLTVQAHGFRTSVTRGFVFVPTQFGAMHFDVALQIGEIIDIIEISDSLRTTF